MNAPTTMSADTRQSWVLHTNLKRRKSPNGINLVFIPGQNVVLELNEVAGDVMDAFAQGPMTYEGLLSSLKETYDVDDVPTFQQEVDQLLERFVKHSLLVPSTTEVAVQTMNEGQP